MSANPKECERCDTPTTELIFYKKRHPTDARGVWLCAYCAVALPSDAAKAMAAMFHVLEQRLRNLMEPPKRKPTVYGYQPDKCEGEPRKPPGAE